MSANADEKWDKAEKTIRLNLETKHPGKKITIVRWRADVCFSVLMEGKALGKIRLGNVDADLAKIA